MARVARRFAVCLAVLVLSATVADARGGGGGGKRGRKARSNSAQAEQLIQDTYRRDLLTRSRVRSW